jgi:hypothetical protein
MFRATHQLLTEGAALTLVSAALHQIAGRTVPGSAVHCLLLDAARIFDRPRPTPTDVPLVDELDRLGGHFQVSAVRLRSLGDQESADLFDRRADQFAARAQALRRDLEPRPETGPARHLRAVG